MIPTHQVDLTGSPLKTHQDVARVIGEGNFEDEGTDGTTLVSVTTREEFLPALQQLGCRAISLEEMRRAPTIA